MAMTSKAFGVTITVISSGESYHTFNDWALSITNQDYIGDPSVETNYLNVPGRNKLIDYSEALTGRPVYKSRPITLKMEGLRERLKWDIEVSKIRNLIHGQLVKLYFDNDVNRYWQGRIYVQDMDRERKKGRIRSFNAGC